MKKAFLILMALLLASSTMPSCAMQFGLYKPEEEYGLLDGFKFNVKGRKEGQKLIELKSETAEEKERLEREKQNNTQEPKVDEYEMFRFMRDGVVPF